MPNSTSTPTLQPPGAGLPWWELLAAKHIVFPAAVRKLTWGSANELFQTEGRKILALWDTTPPDRLTERVLIRRLSGMEDSSRHWSVAMTVEHLNIVGQGMNRIVDSLLRGEVPAGKPNTADVKPKGEQTAADVYAEFVQLLAEPARPEPSSIPTVRHTHPWFGPIDAYQWHCLRGIHQGIHRKQIKAIQGRLGLENSRV
jgi:hypothetical protein